MENDIDKKPKNNQTEKDYMQVKIWCKLTACRATPQGNVTNTYRVQLMNFKQKLWI